MRGMGSKERIKMVIREAESLLEKQPKLAVKLLTLTDREWDGLRFDKLKLDGEWIPPAQQSPHFITVGHSIENYYLNQEAIKEYLKYCFSEHVTPELLTEVSTRFHRFLDLALSYSILAKEKGLLTRCGGAISLEYITWKNGKYYLINSFDQCLLSRGFTNAIGFSDEVNQGIDSYHGEKCIENYSRWLFHGHLGSEAIWACIGALARDLNFPQKVALEMERGYLKEREKYIVDWLSRTENIQRQPLDEAISLLYS